MIVDATDRIGLTVEGFKPTACAVGYGYFARLRGLVAEFLPMMFFMQRARAVLLISLFAEFFARSLLDDSSKMAAQAIWLAARLRRV